MNYKVLGKSILQVIVAYLVAGLFLIGCFILYSSIPEEAWGYIVAIGAVLFVVGVSIYNVYQGNIKKEKKEEISRPHDPPSSK